jgi:hypothetical protein
LILAGILGDEGDRFRENRDSRTRLGAQLLTRSAIKIDSRGWRGEEHRRQGRQGEDGGGREVTTSVVPVS